MPSKHEANSLETSPEPDPRTAYTREFMTGMNPGSSGTVAVLPSSSACPQATRTITFQARPAVGNAHRQSCITNPLRGAL